MNDIESALRRSKVWLNILVDQSECEPDETTITVRVKNADGSTKGEPATLNLGEDLKLLDRAIELVNQTMSEQMLQRIRELDGKV